MEPIATNIAVAAGGLGSVALLMMGTNALVRPPAEKDEPRDKRVLLLYGASALLLAGAMGVRALADPGACMQETAWAWVSMTGLLGAVMTLVLSVVGMTSPAVLGFQSFKGGIGLLLLAAVLATLGLWALSKAEALVL